MALLPETIITTVLVLRRSSSLSVTGRCSGLRRDDWGRVGVMAAPDHTTPARCAVPGAHDSGITAPIHRPALESVLSCRGERNRCCSGKRWAYGISPG